ncbi:MAG: B12-binding domain-containing radical SAM protein [Anaerolineae bacterium]
MHLLFVVKEVDNEPQGLLLISALVKTHGHRVSLVIASQEDPVQAALRLRPDAIGYSVYTGTQRYYLDLNRRLKAQVGAQHAAPLSIFGGPHPTFFPEMVEQDGVDVVCIGEGEYATLELLDAMQAGEDYTGVRNLWLKTAGGIVRNTLRPPLTSAEMDALPYADRRLLYDVHRPSRENHIRPFITTRGCPYNCTFCFNQAYSELYGQYGHKVGVRRRSVDNTLREIQAVAQQYPLSFVVFFDDTFIVHPRWLREFEQRYPAEIGLPFWCQVRANLVDEPVVALLKRSGCVSVSYGIEAGNEHLRNQVLNRNMTRQEIETAARILRQAGIAFSTNNMLGLPSGGLAEDLETLALNVACRPAYANVFLYQPYPKTALGEMAHSQGLMHGGFDDLSGSVSLDSPIKFKSEREGRQIQNLQKLFAVTAEFPWLLPVTKQLVKLPPNPAFWFVYKVWKGYAMKRRMFPYHLTPREWVKAALQYMRIRSQ